ncbi:MAG: DUF4397 domain-containing protein [Acidobacteriota bacterium]|nr:DUF4397 domain-containing protein [Acidobacteriota bacterium]
MNTQLRILFLGLIAASLLTLAACASESANNDQSVTTRSSSGSMTTTAPPAKEAEQRGQALVRLIHAAPGVAALDGFANDSKVFTDVTYKNITAYREVPGADQTLRLRFAGQDSAQPLAEDAESFVKGRHYTVLAVPNSATAIITRDGGQRVDLVFIDDQLAAPAAGKARLRVIHGSPDLGDIDIYAPGRAEAIAQAVSFGSATKYVDTDPTSSALEVRRKGENITTLSVPSTNYQAGKLYTIIVVGQTKGTSKLESIVVTDEFGAASTTASPGTTTTPSMTQIPSATETPGTMPTPATTSTPNAEPATSPTP